MSHKKQKTVKPGRIRAITATGDYKYCKEVPISLGHLSNLSFLDYKLSHLRLYGVYDFLRDEVIFTSPLYVQCKQFVDKYAVRVLNSMEQFYIVRFDAHKPF